MWFKTVPGVATTAVCLNIPGRATRCIDKLSNRHEAERTVHVCYQRSLLDRRISEFISLCDKELENTDYGSIFPTDKKHSVTVTRLSKAYSASEK